MVSYVVTVTLTVDLFVEADNPEQAREQALTAWDEIDIPLDNPTVVNVEKYES
jgi:hypothetical protein